MNSLLFSSSTRITHLVFEAEAFGSCSSLAFCRQQRRRLDSAICEFFSSHPAPGVTAAATSSGGTRPPKACGHSRVVTPSLRCHATCQSLSTEVRGQHLPAAHTPATNRTEEAKLQAFSVDKAARQRGTETAQVSGTYQVTSYSHTSGGHV